MRYLIFLITSVAFSQANKQMTPLIILPNAAHTQEGELRLMNNTNTVYTSLHTNLFGMNIVAPNVAGGDIILVPGNVGPGSSVFIVTPRLDAPSLIIQDHSGTTTSYGLVLETNGGTPYFSVKGGTDATHPGMISGEEMLITQSGSNVGLTVTSSSSSSMVVANSFATTGTAITSTGVYALKAGGIIAPLFDSVYQLGDLTHRFTSVYLSDFSGAGTQAVCADNDGLLIVASCGGGGGSVSLTATSPIVITPSPTTGTGVISCPTCSTSSGGAAWSSYTPTLGNLSSASYDAAYTNNGKDVAFRVAAVGTSNGSLPTVTLPLSPVSVNMSFAVTICTGGACVPGTVTISGSTMTFHIYNNSAFAGSTTYTVVAQGFYDTP